MVAAAGIGQDRGTNRPGPVGGRRTVTSAQLVTTVDDLEGLLVSNEPNARYGVTSVFLEHVTTELHWHDGHLLV